jgi:hypothetical protein
MFLSLFRALSLARALSLSSASLCSTDRERGAQPGTALVQKLTGAQPGIKTDLESFAPCLNPPARKGIYFVVSHKILIVHWVTAVMKAEILG